ncbi:MAG TPA: metallophosphoesterase family protein [Bryobacteraceae bacterium]|nr:metallophosphoesterase family protein [Bryobacteraceae bacterium]
MASNPLRIALVADIHANVWALDAVLADIQKQRVDTVFNLGDILYGPLKPRATYERLRTLGDLLTIRGNQDRQIYDATEQDRRAIPTLDYVIKDLGEDPIQWLQTLPPSAIFEEEIFLCHGTPASDEAYLLEDVASGRAMLRPEAEILRLAKNVRHPVIVCGHSHTPRLVSLANGQMIVNPGSVGLPAYSEDAPVAHVMETYSPHACYAILTKTGAGWDVSFERVTYDYEPASRCAASKGRNDWARAIATGRV